jgi:hypothetical protein
MPSTTVALPDAATVWIPSPNGPGKGGSTAATSSANSSGVNVTTRLMTMRPP